MTFYDEELELEHLCICKTLDFTSMVISDADAWLRVHLGMLEYVLKDPWPNDEHRICYAEWSTRYMNGYPIITKGTKQ